MYTCCHADGGTLHWFLPLLVQVVAPVRATCAQVLGVVCRLLDQPMVECVVGVLLVLVRQEQWEVRHAALMGIQHLLAARTVR